MMRLFLAFAIAFVAVPAANAQAPLAAPARYGPPIAAEQALSIIERGMRISAERGLRMAFAVVEPSGELVAFARMDDVPYASTRLAQQKARTSARLRVTTMHLEERVLRGRWVLLSSDEVIAIGGGVPIVAGGRVVGALGVSGGTAAEDALIAAAAVVDP
jgi:glc operon protein GlcG